MFFCKTANSVLWLLRSTSAPLLDVPAVYISSSRRSGLKWYSAQLPVVKNDGRPIPSFIWNFNKECSSLFLCAQYWDVPRKQAPKYKIFCAMLIAPYCIFSLISSSISGLSPSCCFTMKLLCSSVRLRIIMLCTMNLKYWCCAKRPS